MSRHISSQLIKFIFTGLFFVVFLPMFGQITSGQAILAALVLSKKEAPYLRSLPFRLYTNYSRP